MRTVGVECEIGIGGGRVVELLAERGLVADDYLHDYHCGCGSCTPHRSGPVFTAQEDSTVSAEVISKVLEYGTTEFDTAITALAGCLVDGRAETHDDTGFHVHVALTGDDPDARMRLYRMVGQWEDELQAVAGGADGTVRGYNAPLRYWLESASQFDWHLDPGKDSWLAYRPDHGTVEFRLWDGTTSEFRMRLAVGLSVALMDAAENNASFEGLPMAEVLADYLDDDTFAALLAQLAHVDDL